MKPVLLPRLDVNSESVQLVEWHVEDRDTVEEGALLADVETSKAAFEVPSPGPGHLLRLVEAGAEVPIDEPIGLLFDDVETLEAHLRERPVEDTAQPAADAPQITLKARQLAEELGVDLSALPRGRLITTRDVEQAASRSTTAESRPAERLRPLAGDPRVERVMLIGAGLGATQVLDIFAEHPGQQAVGIVDDDPARWGELVRGVPVVGGTGDLEELNGAGAFDAAIITISTSVSARTRLRDACDRLGIPLTNAIDPRAKLATGVVMGRGNVVCAFCHFGTEARIGDNNFFSAYNSFDHHCVLGSNISTGPSCVASALVTIGDRVRMGTGIFVEPHVTIGAGAQIASGAIILTSVPPDHAVKTTVITTKVVPSRR